VRRRAQIRGGARRILDASRAFIGGTVIDACGGRPCTAVDRAAAS
jgi:hypothetical protein